ncbi:MAG: hypothetical protein WA843_04970, partial [Candidatus Saccharimonadales bacterium]
PRTYIMKITDAGNKTVYQWKQPKAQQVVKPDAAYIVDNMASDPNASYLPGSCSATTCSSLARGGYKFQRFNGWDFAVKTGTTNNGFDGLMTSWSTKYAFVSWVGNHTRNVELNTSMEYLTEPLTRAWMEYAHQDIKPVNWTQPTDIKSLPAFIVRKHIHYGDVEPSPANDLFPAWYVGGTSNKTTAQVMDKVSNKVATSCTPPLAKDSLSNSNVASWNVDIFNGGKTSVGSGGSSTSSSAPTATDDVHNCNDPPPTVTVTPPTTCDTSGCNITVTASQGGHPLAGGSYTTNPAGTIAVQLNGQTINTTSIPAGSSNLYTYSFAYTPTGTGSGTLTATVTDSVLYQGTNTSTLNYSIPSAPIGSPPSP